MLDFSGGISGSRSEYGALPRHVRIADNLIFRPRRAMSVRSGSRRASDTQYANAHSIGALKSTGSYSAFVVQSGTPGVVTDLGTGTAQTIPPGLTSERVSFAQLNGNLWAAPRGGTMKPFFKGPSTGANTWLTSTLPVPGNTLTLTAANTVGPPAGALTSAAGPGQGYYYRLRWRHRDGSSKSSTQQRVAIVAPNNSVNITTIPLGSRSDYLGWTLERAIEVLSAGGVAQPGGWYVVATGTANNFLDTIADNELRQLADEGLHGEPPHIDGIVEYADRLWGWSGSAIYYSNLWLDAEDTGLCNWDAQNWLPIGKDTGDDIQFVVKDVDRLVVVKQFTTWVVDGGTPEEFRAYQIGDSGAGGPRAGFGYGGQVHFYGDRGYYRVSGTKCEPFGFEEMGHYFDKITPGSVETAVLRSWRGQFMLLWCSADHANNGDVIGYDLRFGNWTHFTGWNALDAVEVIGSPFSGASMLIVGTDGYVYSVFDGTLDGRAEDGTGGAGIEWMFETPFIDDGDPDVFKDYSRIEHYIAATADASLSMVLKIEPTAQYAGNLAVTGSGARWGDANWGAFNWAQPSDTPLFGGLPEGYIAKRYALRISGQSEAQFTYNGFVVDFRRRAERRLS